MKTKRWVVCLPVLFSLLLASLPLYAEGSGSLNVGLLRNSGMPFFFQKDGQIYPQGIVYELMEEIGLRLDVEVQYVALPRSRINFALRSNMVHALPMANPKWYRDFELLKWTPAWLTDEDRLLVRSEHAERFQTLSDLKGTRVGTILGYRYPVLDPYINRQDGGSFLQNFERLEAGRVDAVVDSYRLIRYYLGGRADSDSFFIAPMSAGDSARHIGLSEYAPVTVDELSAVLQQMLDDGTVAEILSHY